MEKKYLYTIPSLLAECKRKFGKKPALALQNGKKISYIDMMWDISRTVQTLRTHGIGKSSTVALFTDNSPQTVETLLAVTRMGAVALPLSYDYTKEQVAQIIAAEKPTVLFIQSAKMGNLPAVPSMIILEMADNHVIQAANSPLYSSPVNIQEDDMAAIVYQFAANNTMKRRTFTQRQITEAVSAAKKAKKNKNSVKQSIDSVFAYTRTYFVPMVNGICVNCRDFLTSISGAKQA